MGLNADTFQLYLAKFMGPASTAFFLLVLSIFVVMSFVLDYHWKKYGVRQKTLKIIRLAYFGGGTAIIAAMALIFLYVK